MCKMTSTLIACCLLISCMQSAAEFPDRYTAKSLETRLDQMRNAPIVFVGVVQKVEMLAEPRPASMQPKVSLQLYRARCSVELRLRGDVRSAIDLYYFGPNPADGMVGFPKFWLQAGERRMFFVEQHQGVFRAVGDYLNYTEQVYSGKHLQQVLEADEKMGEIIARILLQPGQGMNEDVFSSNLFGASQIADQFATPAYSRELLEQLTKHRNEKLRSKACYILAKFYGDPNLCEP